MLYRSRLRHWILKYPDGTLFISVLPIALIMLGCWVFLRRFIMLDPDWHHDGILLKPALDVAKGNALFRDVFSQYGLLTTWLHALAIKASEPTLSSLRLFHGFIFSACGLAIYLLSRLLMPVPVAVGVVLFWLFLSPYPMMSFFLNSSSIALIFLLLGTLSLAYSELKLPQLTPAALVLAFLSGLFFSLAFWARQPVGITLASTGLAPLTLLILCRYREQRTYRIYQTFSYAAGGALGLLSGLLILTVTSSVEDWWTQSIIAARKFAELSPNGLTLDNVLYRLFPQPHHVHGSIPSNLWRWLPISVIAVLTGLVFRGVFKSEIRAKPRLLIVVSFVSIGSWIQYFPIPDIAHVFWAATPMLPLAAASIYLIFTKLKIKRHINILLTTTILATLLFPNMQPRWTAWNSIGQTDHLPLEILGGMRGSTEFFKKIKWRGTKESYLAQLDDLDQFIDAFQDIFPDKHLLTFTEDAFTPSVIPKNGPHPIFLWWPWLISLYPDHSETVGQFIHEKKPLIEIKVNQPGGWSWLEPMSEHRTRYKFSQYRPILYFTLGDHGQRAILADPTTIAELRGANIKVLNID